MMAPDAAGGDTGGASRVARGLERRRRVLGEEHVDRALASACSLDAPFQAYITGAVWEDVWGRGTLSLRDRRLLTIAVLAALGHQGELALHVRAAVEGGMGVEELGEVLLHAGVYAGVPATNAALSTARRVLEELGHPAAEAFGDPAKVLTGDLAEHDPRSAVSEDTENDDD